jgi:hypothetical protein
MPRLRVPPRLAAGLGIAAIAVLVALFRVADASDTWMYRGGFLLAGLVSIALVAAVVVAPHHGISRPLAWRPLVWVGSISYGIYLWHWPIYIFMDETRTGLSGGALLALRIVDTVAVAAASFFLIERPLRLGWAASTRRIVGGFAVASVATAICFFASTSYVSNLDSSLETVVAVAGAPRVLVAGDSSAFTLAEGYDGAGNLHVETVAILGCGVVRGQNQPLTHPPFSNRSHCDDWPEDWAEAERRFEPDLTLLGIGAWEVFDKKVDDRVLAVGSDEWDDYVDSELEIAFSEATADGKPLVIMNVPCYRSVASLQGEPNPEQEDPNRITAMNDALERLEDAHPAAVRLLDLHSLLCPDGHYVERINGVLVREDGIHFTEGGASIVWQWLAPQLLDIVAATRT